MAWARRAGVYADKPVSVSGSSDTLAAAGAVSAADCIIATASYTGTTTMHATTGFTDSLGNSYNTYGPVVDGSNRKCYIGVALNSGAGTPTVTFTFSGTTVATLTVDAFSGVATSSAKDGSDGTGTTASGTTVAISGTTSTVANDLLYVACLAGAATTWSNAGYTIVQPLASRTMVGFADSGTAGAESTTCTSSATTALVGLMIALKAAASVSFTVAPTGVPSGHAGNITLTLTGTGTAWVNGVSVFTPSGVANVTKVSQNVTSATAATVVITTGAGTGTLTITESVTGTGTATTTVGAPSFTRSPTSITVSTTGNVITLVGTNTLWTDKSVTFTLSGGTGASITAQNVTSNTAATVTVSAGSATGTNNLTITDPDSGATNTLTVAASTSILISDTNIGWELPGVTVEISGSTYARPFYHGAGARMGFSGTKITINFDWTGVTGDAANLPLLAFTDNGKKWQFHQLVTSDTAYAAFSGLTDTDHDFEFRYEQLRNSGGGAGNSWTATECPKITSFTVDRGPAVAHSQGARTKKIAIISQSTETGVNDLGLTSVALNSYIRNWTYGWTQGWNVAIGNIAAPGWGLLATADTGQPKFYDPTDVAGSSYLNIASGVVRSYASLDACVIFISGNDFRSNISGGSPTLVAIQAAIEGLCDALRTANSTMKIIWCILPNGLGRSTITTAIAARNAAGKSITLIDGGARIMYAIDGATPVTNAAESVYMADPPHQQEVGGQMVQAALGPLIYNEIFDIGGGGGSGSGGAALGLLR